MSYNKQYKDFYQFPTIEKLQEMISTDKLTNATIYTFLDGYSKYQEEQIGFDSPN